MKPKSKVLAHIAVSVWLAALTGTVTIVIAIMPLLSPLPSSVKAQAAWTPEVLDQGPAAIPALVVDSQGQVHALWIHLFSLQEDGGPDAVFYARRDRAGVWTASLDVLVPPTGERITSLAAGIDGTDTMHLILNLQDGLYYSAALTQEADRASNWLKPVRISRAHAGPSGIALGSDGALHVVYPEIYAPPGILFYIHSLDGGLTWREPRPVYVASHPQGVPINSQIAVAASGRLHVVWTESIGGPSPSGVYYAFSDDGGQSWSEARLMDGPGHGWIGVGLESDESRVHLIWTGTSEVRGKYHALSVDGGVSWGEPEEVFYGWAGMLGFSSFALDSAGDLHLVTALARGFPQQGKEWMGDDWQSEGDIFHTTWQGVEWDMPEHVSAAVWERRLEQCCPSAVVSEGNLLHLAWSGTYHPEDEVRPVWYSVRQLDAPRTEVSRSPPPAPRPSPSPGASGLPTEVAPAAAETPLAETPSIEFLPPDNAQAGRQPLDALLFGIVPAAMLIVVVVAVTVLRRER